MVCSTLLLAVLLCAFAQLATAAPTQPPNSDICAEYRNGHYAKDGRNAPLPAWCDPLPTSSTQRVCGANKRLTDKSLSPDEDLPFVVKLTTGHSWVSSGVHLKMDDGRFLRAALFSSQLGDPHLQCDWNMNGTLCGTGELKVADTLKNQLKIQTTDGVRGQIYEDGVRFVLKYLKTGVAVHAHIDNGNSNEVAICYAPFPTGYPATTSHKATVFLLMDGVRTRNDNELKRDVATTIFKINSSGYKPRSATSTPFCRLPRGISEKKVARTDIDLRDFNQVTIKHEYHHFAGVQ